MNRTQEIICISLLMAFDADRHELWRGKPDPEPLLTLPIRCRVGHYELYLNGVSYFYTLNKCEIWTWFDVDMVVVEHYRQLCDFELVIRKHN